MARSYSFLIFLIVLFLSLTNADLRLRRSPQFSQASASAGSFGNYPRGFEQPYFGPPRPPIFAPRPPFLGRSSVFERPGFGNSGYGKPGFGNPGFGNPGFGNPGFGNPGFGRPGLGRPGGSINISKSISISTGSGRGEARSSAGGFGK